MSERVLTTGELNRALLARQLLLERARPSFADAIAQVGALQTQYAPSAYVGLWTRVHGVTRDAVTEALEDGSLVQGTLLRVTIHLVGREAYWRHAVAIRASRRQWFLRVEEREAAARPALEARMHAGADALRMALADGPRTVRELGPLVTGFLGNAGLWVDLVRVPPSGTWDRRRADRLALAEQWVGPENVTEEEGLTDVVASYLRAFGPAPWKDVASWAGIPVADAKRGGANLDLATYRDEAGRPLVDLRDAPLPDATTPAPVRFLPNWDALTLAHARRTGVLDEETRARVYNIHTPFAPAAVLVEGRVAGEWKFDQGSIAVIPYAPFAADVRDAVEEERVALEAFHA